MRPDTIRTTRDTPTAPLHIARWPGSAATIRPATGPGGACSRVAASPLSGPGSLLLATRSREHAGPTRGGRTATRPRAAALLRAGALVAALLLAFSRPARSQDGESPPPARGRQEALPAPLEGVGVTERAGEAIPLDLRFTDETGRSVRLGDYFNDGLPVLLNLGYYRCPMLCGLVLQGLLEGLDGLPLAPGEDFQIVSVSIDPREEPPLAREKKRNTIEALGRAGAADGWHFLTGRAEAIRDLTQGVGFGYRWLEDREEFAHTAVLVILTPTGKISRYLYGVRYPRSTLRLSLVEASQGKVGSALDQLLLYCFRYDAEEGRYALAAMNIMRLGAALTVLTLALILGNALRRDLKRRRRDRPSPATGTTGSATS